MKNDFSQFVKYAIVNSTLTGLYFVLFFAINEFSCLNYLVANIASYVIATSLAFICTKIYVFKAREFIKKEIFEFIVVRLGIVGLNSLGLWWVTIYLGIGEYFAFWSVNGAVYIMSYYLNKKIFTRRGA